MFFKLYYLVYISTIRHCAYCSQRVAAESILHSVQMRCLKTMNFPVESLIYNVQKYDVHIKVRRFRFIQVPYLILMLLFCRKAIHNLSVFDPSSIYPNMEILFSKLHRHSIHLYKKRKEKTIIRPLQTEEISYSAAFYC